jgi:hypothetical protein
MRSARTANGIWGRCFLDIYIPRDQLDLSLVGGLAVSPSVRPDMRQKISRGGATEGFSLAPLQLVRASAH